MTPTRGKAIVLTDGGLPSLLVSAMEAERGLRDGGGGGLLLPACAYGRTEAPRREAIISQGRFFGLPLAEPVVPPPSLGDGPPGYEHTQTLVSALYTALTSRCTRVVWPIQFHHDDETLADDLDRIGAAADRALLIARLAMLDAPTEAGEELIIETPLIDLTEAQITDLVVDLDAPVYLTWWWRPSADSHTESLALTEREAWIPALERVGWVNAGPAPQTLAAGKAGSPVSLRAAPTQPRPRLRPDG